LRRTIDSSITILISLSDHLIDLIICQLLANGRHDMTELSSRDEAIVITIEDLNDQHPLSLDFADRAHLERLSDLLLGVGILHLSCHHCEELCVKSV
jgi:hypothetical protein